MENNTMELDITSEAATVREQSKTSQHSGKLTFEKLPYPTSCKAVARILFRGCLLVLEQADKQPSQPFIRVCRSVLSSQSTVELHHLILTRVLFSSYTVYVSKCNIYIIHYLISGGV